jgi:hypothetical protein
MHLSDLKPAPTIENVTKGKAAFCLATVLALPACEPASKLGDDVTTAPWECLSAKVTIGTNSIDTVVRYHKFNGEAQFLNSVSFASKTTGAQGNVIGWVPLGDLRPAVQELIQREEAAQQQAPAPIATPTPTPEPKKKP